MTKKELEQMAQQAYRHDDLVENPCPHCGGTGVVPLFAGIHNKPHDVGDVMALEECRYCRREQATWDDVATCRAETAKEVSNG